MLQAILLTSSLLLVVGMCASLMLLASVRVRSEQALPARLIVTHRLLPGQPNMIVEFSDWNFGTRHPDSEFAFQPPPGPAMSPSATPTS